MLVGVILGRQSFSGSLSALPGELNWPLCEYDSRPFDTDWDVDHIARTLDLPMGVSD
jgi:hypothetical protein